MIQVLHQLTKEIRESSESLPAGCPTKQAFKAGSNEQSEDGEQQDRAAEACEHLSDDVPEDVLRSEQARHHYNRGPEQGYCNKPRNRKEPRRFREPGVLCAHLISLHTTPPSRAAYRIYSPRTPLV